MFLQPLPVLGASKIRHDFEALRDRASDSEKAMAAKSPPGPIRAEQRRIAMIAIGP